MLKHAVSFLRGQKLPLGEQKNMYVQLRYFVAYKQIYYSISVVLNVTGDGGQLGKKVKRRLGRG